VHEPEGSERALDGVVLAFAGLIRLWADEPGRAELEKLLQGVRWMVLPLRECPAAPAQGALAVECRASDARVRAALGRLHHAPTAALVARERQLLADWGGGCHQKFGATAVEGRELGAMMYVRGRKPDETFVEELRWEAPMRSGARGPAWDGARSRESLEGVAHLETPSLRSAGAVFIAHARALPEGSALAPDARVWASGSASWFKLAVRGVWVEGCAEGLGFESLTATLAEPVLRLPAFGPDWTVLTHEEAAQGWEGARVVATYRLPAGGAEAPAGLEQARYLYWSSGSQFERWGRYAAGEARHACGPGKTAAQLRARGIVPEVFPSAEEWRRWLSID
jgi:hydroxymethylbilane synthase